MRRFVSVDLETTGVDMEKDYIVEVGLVGEGFDGAHFEETFSLDFPKEAMTAGAAAINGWGKRQFAPIVTHNYAVGQLQILLHDAHIIGKNPYFDERFLRRLFRDAYDNPTPPWHHRLVDIGSLAWGYHSYARVGDSVRQAPPNVDEVAKMLGFPRETVNGYHTALSDAKWNYQVFRHMIPRFEESPCSS